MKPINMKRFIRSKPVPRLDIQEVTGTGGSGTGTDHTHANLTTLDKLAIDIDTRLTYNGEVISSPLHQEDW